MSKTRKTINRIVVIAVFSAIAYLCCVLFHFKAAGFLSFDLKDAIMTVAGMIFGPLYGLIMVVLVSVIEMVTISSTGFYGLIMNILSSGTFVCVAGLVYMKRKTMGGALTSMICAVCSTVVVMMGANLLVTSRYFGMTVSEVAALIPSILLPFNLIKTVFNSAIVFILYKPVVTALRSSGLLPSEGSGIGHWRKYAGNSKKNILVSVAAIVVAVGVMVFFFLYPSLHGTFSLAG